MEHYYQNIEGWFNFGKLYTDMVNKYPDGSHFVEVGVWHGRSAVYMGVEIINSNKKIKFDCVDSWGSSQTLETFLKNIEPLQGTINYHRLTSIEASGLYENESLDFVYIDSSHTYGDVKDDLVHWFPKVREGGVIAGHDYDGEGVRRAVDEFFIDKKFKIKVLAEPEISHETSWFYYKKPVMSLAITTFNRNIFTIESFIQVIDNDLVEEIVIVDDCSDMGIFNKLSNIIINLDRDKIRLYRNETNLGPFVNKYEAVKKCNNKWVVLLDSDNIIGNDYVKIISEIGRKDDILYCPQTLYDVNKDIIGWTYGEFSNTIIDRVSVQDYIDNNNFSPHMNTGNYFLNRDRYIDIIDQNKDGDGTLVVNDAIYFYYLWLSAGNRVVIVPDLCYIHRVHNKSWFMLNRGECVSATIEIKQKIKELKQ